MVDITPEMSEGIDELYAEFFRCPNCGDAHIVKRFKHCPNCGTSLHHVTMTAPKATSKDCAGTSITQYGYMGLWD